MTLYAVYHVWPPVNNVRIAFIGVEHVDSWKLLKQFTAAAESSVLLLPARGIVLVYLAFASISVEIGIAGLLWQQLQYIYEGSTYISHINSYGDKGCQ